MFVIWLKLQSCSSTVIATTRHGRSILPSFPLLRSVRTAAGLTTVVVTVFVLWVPMELRQGFVGLTVATLLSGLLTSCLLT